MSFNIKKMEPLDTFYVFVVGTLLNAGTGLVKGLIFASMIYLFESFLTFIVPQKYLLVLKVVKDYTSSDFIKIFIIIAGFSNSIGGMLNFILETKRNWLINNRREQVKIHYRAFLEEGDLVDKDEEEYYCGYSEKELWKIRSILKILVRKIFWDGFISFSIGFFALKDLLVDIPEPTKSVHSTTALKCSKSHSQDQNKELGGRLGSLNLLILIVSLSIVLGEFLITGVSLLLSFLTGAELPLLIFQNQILNLIEALKLSGDYN